MFPSLPSSSSLFFLCLLFFLLHSPPVSMVDPPLTTICGNGNYTANSTYETNLKLLLFSLVSNAGVSGGFSSAMIGQFPNQTYGLALCRGDVDPSLCHSWLDTASHDIIVHCHNKIEAIVWYDLCLLRYSNQMSLSPNEGSEMILGWNVNVTTDIPLFEKLVDGLLSAITDWAAYNTTMRFATGEVNITTYFPTIYGLVQCTPDLGAAPCRQCLQNISNPRPLKLKGREGQGR